MKVNTYEREYKIHGRETKARIPKETKKFEREIYNTRGTGYPDKAKMSGIKVRGTGAATQGLYARGPMA